MKSRRVLSSILMLVALPALVMMAGAGSHAVAEGADWPTWRYDAQNRAVSPHELAEELHLQWVRELPEPKRCWAFQFDDAEKLAFDVSYEPVVAGDTIFVASMVTDSITAYDTSTGDERWRFYADGPFRFAPVIAEGRLYAGCDDGFLYCLDADDGSLLWSFRNAPPQRWLLGNERLIDTWPVRGAPAVVDDTVFFTSGVWPFMGVFVNALDAETGEVIWTNTGTGSIYNLYQHRAAYGFGGVVPHGYLAVTEDKVLVPGGRATPAVFDRHTGELLFYHHATEIVGKGAGGYRVWAQGDWFFNHGLPVRDQTNFMYSLEDGAQFRTLSAQVVSEDHLLGVEGDELVAYAPEPEENDIWLENRLARRSLSRKYSLVELWRVEPEIDLTEVHLQAGGRIYASGPDGLVAALDLPEGDDAEPRLSWQSEVDGDVWRMIAAGGRLFVVTEQGSIHAFGAESGEVAVHRWEPRELTTAADGWAERAAGIIEQTGATEGYAMLWGLGGGRLMEELLRQSDLHIIAVEPDGAKVEQMRRRLSDAGLYGRRAAVLHGDPMEMQFSPYMASLVAVEDAQAAGIERGAEFAESVFHVLRPYGGAAWLPVDDAARDRLARLSERAGLENARIDGGEGFATLTREGPLPGAGSWTHQYGDAQNTNFSPDQFVRAPLGVLWYGGPSNHDVLPRHRAGPSPQVIEGRLFIMGPNTITARDVYTGRQIWQHRWDGVGHIFTCLDHEEEWQTGAMVFFGGTAGANATGSPYVSVEDGLYVTHGEVCRRLDPATGEVMAEFTLPDGSQWGHLMVHDDLLIAGADPQIFEEKPFGESNSWDGTSSDRLIVMDRHSGEVLWTREATYGFRHNAIIASGDTVFAIDNLSEQPLEILRRRGQEWTVEPFVVALDARTGEERWISDTDTFGTFLIFSEEHDILLQAGRRARIRLSDEPQNRIIAHRGADGSVIWDRQERCVSHPGVRGDMIIGIRGRTAICLLTGENLSRVNPVTGADAPWRYQRAYGCGTQTLGEHLITFRSSTAGYYDVERDGGTGNLGGFRAGCTNNLIIADGVLNAPDYTRTCTCSYPLQTSLGLVHMPEVEMWTYVPYDLDGHPVRRLGVNLGAPGHRMTDEGTLWVNHDPDPRGSLWDDYEDLREGGTIGSQLDLPVAFSGRRAGWYVEHPWRFDGADSYEWVAASGVEGTGDLRIRVADDAEEIAESSYVVRLHFAEPGEARPGERLANVFVQGRQVLREFDVVAESGAARRATVAEVSSVKATDVIRVAIASADGSKLPPVLSGVELLNEEAHAASPEAIDWASAAPSLFHQIVDGLREMIADGYATLATLLSR